MSYDNQVDENQAEIVEALRKVGLSVVSLHRDGRGIPDLLVGGHISCPHCSWMFPQTYLIEVKMPNGHLNGRQEKMWSTWYGQIAIARTVEEALALVGRTGSPDLRFIEDGRAGLDREEAARQRKAQARLHAGRAHRVPAESEC